MSSIPESYAGEPDLQHLRVFETLLRERSLTRAAHILNVTQPALSKTLARLRRYFDDPLFVRVALRMEPTAKALELQAPVGAILERMRLLRAEHVPFDPRLSHRTFAFCVVDAGVIKLLPPLVNRLMEEAPNVRLSVLQLDSDHLESWLESGKVDFRHGLLPVPGQGNPPPAIMGRALCERLSQGSSAAIACAFGSGLCRGKACACHDIRNRARAPARRTRP
jgi:DNA-binding transcriptional LysR family regulator